MAADGEPVPGSLFVYKPNTIAPIVFAVAYGISAVFHFWQCHKHRARSLIGLHPLCAATFAAGYAVRAVGANDHYIYSKENESNLILFIMTQILVFICPPLLELANYHILGRLFHYVPHKAPYPASRVLLTFGAVMGLIEFLNSLGVAFASNPTGRLQATGSNLILGALALQLFVIASFLVLAFIFHYRCIRADIRTKAVSIPLFTLYASMALILARSIYRLIEHLGNTHINLKDIESLRRLSPILRFEWYFYVFEATLMLVNSILWNIWNPCRFLPAKNNIHLDRDGKTEIVGPVIKDHRSIGARIGNILTFGLFFRQRKQSQSFEELVEHPNTGYRY